MSSNALFFGSENSVFTRSGTLPSSVGVVNMSSPFNFDSDCEEQEVQPISKRPKICNKADTKSNRLSDTDSSVGIFLSDTSANECDNSERDLSDSESSEAIYPSDSDVSLEGLELPFSSPTCISESPSDDSDSSEYRPCCEGFC